MASVVDICNTALTELSGAYITSLDDASKAAKLCKSSYYQCRDSLLREHTWNFAKRRRTLARLTDAPDFGYQYQYQLPVDYLRFIGFYNDPQERILYEIEGDKLLTDNATAQIHYITKITDTTLHDPLFDEVLAYRLAARIAYGLTGNRTLKSEMANMERASLSTAKSINGQELNDQREERSNWLDSRNTDTDYSVVR